MTNATKIGRLIQGAYRDIDVSASGNSLQVNELKVGTGGSPTSLTQAILNNLLGLLDGSDVSASLHHHDGRYFTESEMQSVTDGSSGADNVGSTVISGISGSTVQAQLESMKAYIDNQIGGYDDASEITYTPSVLTDWDGDADPGNVDGALDQLAERVDDNESAISSNASAASTAQSAADDAQDEVDAIEVALGAMVDANGDYVAHSGSNYIDGNSDVAEDLTDLDTQVKSNADAIGLRALDSAVIKKDGSVAFTGDQAMGGNKLTGLGAPSGDNDAARKIDVDTSQAGINMKDAVRASTTAALPAVTYDNGTGGVGATLTADADGALADQDGVSLSVDDRLLVKNQAAPLQNGLYEVTQLGDGGNPFILTRAEDFDGSPANEVSGGNMVWVEEGTLNQKTQFIVTGQDDKDVGTDSVEFVIFSRVENIIAGNGLQRSGVTISLDFSEFDSDDITEGSTNLFLTSAERTKLGYISVTGAVDLDTLSSDSHTHSNKAVLDATTASFTTGDESKLDGIEAGAKDDQSAAEVPFTPDENGDWDSVPSEVASGLDELASRAKALESQGSNDAVVESMVAGESMAANTLWCVRVAKGAETTGRVYKADKDASSNDDFHVIGLVYSTSAISASDSVIVYKFGKFDLGAAHSLTLGHPHFLGSAGAVIDGGTEGANAPSGSSEAVVEIGIAREANVLEVGIVKHGVNAA